MAHVGKSGNNLQLEQLAAPPKPVAPPPRMQGRPAHVAGGGRIDVVPAGSIDGQAGVRHGLQPRSTDLGHFVAVAARLNGQRYVSLRRSRGARSERKAEDEEKEDAFLDAVQDVFYMLERDSSQRNRDELDKHFANYLEPIQRLKVLVEALQRLRNEELPVSKKAVMGRALNGMYTTLMKKHAHEIRAVLQEKETDEAGAKVDVLSDDLPWSVRLRQLIFQKDEGRFDAPITSRTVLQSLIKYFGSNALAAMCGVRSRMISGL